MFNGQSLSGPVRRIQALFGLRGKKVTLLSRHCTGYGGRGGVLGLLGLWGLFMGL